MNKKAKNMARNNSSNGGCGCLILIVIAIAFVVNKCNDGDKTSTTKEKAITNSSSYQSSNMADYSQKEELSNEERQYIKNSLSTGASPYASFYGSNYKCPYDQCSGIRVTAPAESDIVVIIKRDNQDGKVISHGYIRAGQTYLFDIPDGTYQTFFYYGEGWNPTKDMGNGIKGGFVKDEIFSKDNPQELYSGILTYVLQLQRDGNFQTRSSRRSEFF